jgi:sugar phosphate isomerase/epimerase
MFECWNIATGFDFERVFKFIADCGYDGVEIAPFTLHNNAYFITAETRCRVRQLAKAAGLEVSAIHWLLARTDGYYLTSPDPVVRQKTGDYFNELVRLCDDIGGRFMVLGSPQQRNLLDGVSNDDAIRYAADTLLHTIPLLEATGIRIAIEPLSSAETNFLTTAAGTIKLIEEINQPDKIALHLDCKAMASETLAIPEIIKRSSKYLTYFHFNDKNLQGPGFGDMKFEPIVAALNEVKYDGWGSVEVFDYSPGVERLAIESLVTLRGC